MDGKGMDVIYIYRRLNYLHPAKTPSYMHKRNIKKFAQARPFRPTSF